MGLQAKAPTCAGRSGTKANSHISLVRCSLPSALWAAAVKPMGYPLWLGSPWSNEKACRYPMRLPDAWLAWLSYRSCKHFLGGIVSSFCRAFRDSGPRGTMCQGNEIRNRAYAIILCSLQTYYSEYQRLLARSMRETLRESITS